MNKKQIEDNETILDEFDGDYQKKISSLPKSEREPRNHFKRDTMRERQRR